MTKFELSRLVEYNNDTLIAEIRRVANLIDTPYFTRGQFDRYGKASSSTVQKRFGSWERALAMAGLIDLYSDSAHAKALRRASGRQFTDAEMLEELRAVALKLGRDPVTVTAFQQHGPMNAETIRRRFGSWWKALQKAGLPISNLGRRYSTDDYFENLLSVWIHYGRQPTYGEMALSPSRIAAKAYEARWGTWRKALLAFIDRAEKQDTEVTAPEVPDGQQTIAQDRQLAVRRVQQRRKSQETAEQKVSLRPSRHISWRLRFLVMRRDGFRCLQCGNSPATSPGVILQLDHTDAWTKGGPTTMENLRTLCSVCNIGKSDLSLEEVNTTGKQWN